ncbi:MAG TPA: hypothetical protein VNG12_25805 [Acidimicrobiales bacterium]|nr:hypothetical protein [Acidimicrobiales bacterium]
MADALQRARRQLARRRALRRRVPALVVGTLASLGVGAAAAWVSPKARVPVTANTAATAQLARNFAALRQTSQALAAAVAQIDALPRFVVTSPTGQSAASAAPGPSIAPVIVPTLPPAVHATTGASGVP